MLAYRLEENNELKENDSKYTLFVGYLPYRSLKLQYKEEGFIGGQVFINPKNGNVKIRLRTDSEKLDITDEVFYHSNLTAIEAMQVYCRL